MKTLDEVRARCEIEEETGCWSWTGALSCGIPRIYAPDLAATERRLSAALKSAFESARPGRLVKAALLQAMDPIMEAQAGRRAVWQMATGKSIKDGHIAYTTCLNGMCVNPDHIACGTGAELGRFTAKVGRYKGQPARILANYRIGRQRSTLKPEHYVEIQLSPESGLAIGARLGYSRSVVSKVRRGHPMVHRPRGALFMGLGG